MYLYSWTHYVKKKNNTKKVTNNYSLIRAQTLWVEPSVNKTTEYQRLM